MRSLYPICRQKAMAPMGRLTEHGPEHRHAHRTVQKSLALGGIDRVVCLEDRGPFDARAEQDARDGNPSGSAQQAANALAMSAA
jgi:hypothetical protein